jgi:predicted DNA-binding protein (UPF0251 family)
MKDIGQRQAPKKRLEEVYYTEGCLSIPGIHEEVLRLRMEGYKPIGIPLRELASVNLLYEEFEAIRLVDYENLTQEEATVRMTISRPTFTRLYDKARKSVDKAFGEGKAIIFQGGTYSIEDYWYKCQDCHETLNTIKPIKLCRKCDSEKITPLTTATPINPQSSV